MFEFFYLEEAAITSSTCLFIAPAVEHNPFYMITVKLHLHNQAHPTSQTKTQTKDTNDQTHFGDPLFPHQTSQMFYRSVQNTTGRTPMRYKHDLFTSRSAHNLDARFYNESTMHSKAWTAILTSTKTRRPAARTRARPGARARSRGARARSWDKGWATPPQPEDQPKTVQVQGGREPPWEGEGGNRNILVLPRPPGPPR